MSGRRAAWLAAAALLCACAAGPQTQRVQRERTAVELSAVPFFPQEAYQCGPAALATVLTAAGVDASPAALVDEVYVPARRGSLQAEMLAAVRRRAHLPVVLDPKIDAALRELQAGRPVLVLQNLGAGPVPVWHYAVLIGFDPRAQHFILRSGRERRLTLSARRFLETWDRGGRWMLVVADVDTPPASAGVDGWLRAAAPLESLGQMALAERAYEAAVQRWPDAALAWTALGNARAATGALRPALDAYRRALALEDKPLLRNNYAWTLAAAGCRDAAIAQLQAGLQQADVGERAVLEGTLQEIESARPGDAQCAM